MEERPDLPGLESVKWRGGICAMAAVVSALGGFYAFVPIVVICGAISSTDTHLIDLLMVLAFLAIPLLPLVWAFSTRLFDYRWQTSTEGLTVKRVIGRVFLPWSQIDSVKTLPSFPWFAPCYVLRAGRKSAIIPCRDPRLGASIWQHLRRRGLHDRIMLPVDAQSLWFPIPDDVPDSVSWQDTIGVSAGCTCATELLLLIAGAIAVAVLLMFGLWQFAVAAGALALFLFLKHFATTPHAKQIELDENTLRLHLRMSSNRVGVVQFQWDNLLAAKWSIFGLNLYWPHSPRFTVPWESRDPSSTRLVLAIIKRLRMLPQPVLIPFPMDLAHHLAKVGKGGEQNDVFQESVDRDSSAHIEATSDSQVFAVTWSTRLRVTSTAKLAICVLALAGVITVAFVWRNPWFGAFYGFWLLILLLVSFFAYTDTPVGYSIGDQFLEIRRKRGEFRAKISDLASARSEDASIVFQGAYTFRSKRWRPWVIGPYKSPGMGEDSSFLSFASSREGRVVVLERNEGCAIILSPDDVEGFARAVNAAIAKARTEQEPTDCAPPPPPPTILI